MAIGGKSPEKAWRDLSNYAYCKSCFRDYLYDDYNESTITWIMNALVDTYQYKFNRFYNHLMFIECPHCWSDTMVLETETNGNGRTYKEIGGECSCGECGAFMEFNNQGKVIKWGKNEDEFRSKYPSKPK